LFFFQAEDGIRDLIVTGVQTCALPIWSRPTDGRCRLAPISPRPSRPQPEVNAVLPADMNHGLPPAPPPLRRAEPIRSSSLPTTKIGRASCRERVYNTGVGE